MGDVIPFPGNPEKSEYSKLILTISDDALDDIEGFAREKGQSVPDMLAGSIALYKFCTEAVGNGGQLLMRHHPTSLPGRLWEAVSGPLYREIILQD